jgi:peptide/nickel transport system substrate-binding protein
MKKKMLGLFLATALLLTMVTACVNKASTEGGTTVKAPVKDSVILAISGDMGTLDSLHSGAGMDKQIYKNIFDALVKNGASEVEPSLAENWKMSDDGLSYTFALKKGIKFHNGEVLKASDVVFSLTTAKASPYLAEQTAAIKEAVAVDDNTVRINLSYQYAPFLLSLTEIYIVPEKAYIEAGKAFGQKPIGTGAYKFVSHAVGQNVKLERFDEYYGGVAPIKNVTFKIITDPSAILIALQTKEVDFALDLAMVQVKSAKANPELNVAELEGNGLTCLIMNNSIKPFTNVKVRQALNYAINKENAIVLAEEGLGQPAVCPFNKTYFGYSDKIKGYEYNIEKAKALLTEAGYPNGFEVTLKTMAGSLQKGAQSIQEDLRKIGVIVKIEMVEGNAYIQDITTGNYQIGNITISSSVPDIDFWDMFLSTKGGMNVFKYSNPKVDQLFTEAKKSSDTNVRLAKYQELTQILVDDAAMVPLYYMVRTYIADRDLKVGNADGVYGVSVNSLSWSK